MGFRFTALGGESVIHLSRFTGSPSVNRPGDKRVFIAFRVV